MGWKTSSNASSPTRGEPGEAHQGESQPLTDHRDVTSPKERQCVGLHRPNVRGNLLGIIARARAIRTGYEDHQPSAWIHGRASCTKGVVHPTPYRNSFARLAPCARSH